ncbi:MAG TPA: methylated-DNA--[protein]-cysteine S-methyltransferase [Anaeromyxobacter sp.]
MILLVDSFPSPIGPVSLASDGRALCALDFEGLDDLARRLRARFGEGAALRRVADPQGFTSRARAYFAGELDALADVPVDGGGTGFQRRVWAALREIPAGETRTYSALAARLGVPRAARAVGLANARNPIAIAVPCHRVIGADGTLTGYAGGLERKRWLLAHESARLPLFAAAR